jgi:hypothetical protein
MRRCTGLVVTVCFCVLPLMAAPEFGEWLKRDAEARKQFQNGRTVVPPDSPIGDARAKDNSRAHPVEQDGQPGWLVMVYMAADNNLDEEALDDVLEMQTIGSSDSLSITVLMDRVDYGDWTEARRFLVGRPASQGGKASWDLSLPTCEAMGELNMGDPAVLTDFVKWSMEHYRQPNTMLVLWNHGGGWRSSDGDAPLRRLNPLRVNQQRNTRGIAYDDTDGDFLEMREVRSALESFPRFSVIGADACLMGMIEVAYELRDQGRYFIGSQDLEPGNGWAYDRWLPSLKANPALDPENLCRRVVETYSESYGTKPVTLSAVRLDAISALATAVDDVACGVIDYLESGDGKPVDFEGLPWFSPKSPKFVDLGAFLARLKSTMPSRLATRAQKAMHVLGETVVINASASQLKGTGLCIYPGGGNDERDYRSGIIQFARDTRWDEMLREMAYHDQQRVRAVMEQGDPNRWAVLIGVAEYADTSIPSLRYSVADVESLRKVLVEKAGYRPENIYVLTNSDATVESVRSTLGTWLPRKVADQDMVMIYFSGHGGAEPAIRGHNEDGTEKYMMLADSRLDDMYGTALPMGELSRIFGRIRADKLLFVMDSCYAGAAGDGGKGVLREGMKAIGLSDDYLNSLTGSSGTVVLTASRASEVSMESSTYGMGVFTHFLCEAFSKGDTDGDGLVSVMELYQHLNHHVPAAAKTLGASQHPVLKGEISGSFPIAVIQEEQK